jgi:predicted transposase YbfD/YdcC
MVNSVKFIEEIVEVVLIKGSLHWIQDDSFQDDL